MSAFEIREFRKPTAAANVARGLLNAARVSGHIDGRPFVGVDCVLLDASRLRSHVRKILAVPHPVFASTDRGDLSRIHPSTRCVRPVTLIAREVIHHKIGNAAIFLRPDGSLACVVDLRLDPPATLYLADEVPQTLTDAPTAAETRYFVAPLAPHCQISQAAADYVRRSRS